MNSALGARCLINKSGVVELRVATPVIWGSSPGYLMLQSVKHHGFEPTKYVNLCMSLTRTTPA